MKNITHDLSEAIGSFIEYWGFKSIHGKIWLLLYLHDQAMSSRKIRENLEISKASLSTSINELKLYKVILEAGRGKHGVELFIANPNVMEAIFNVLKSREKNIISNVFDEIKKLQGYGPKKLEEMNISSSRLNSLLKLVKFAGRAVDQFLKLDNLILSKLRMFKKT